MAPHVVYRSEAEYDADLQRMTLMGYVPIEVYRTPATDGFSFDVRYQLLDREQFNRAALTAGQAGALEDTNSHSGNGTASLRTVLTTRCPGCGRKEI